MRRTIITLTVMALLVVGLIGPAGAKQAWSGPDNGMSIVGTAVAVSGGIGAYDENGGDFDILIGALVATGAVNLFDGTKYTVFAPTDQAFMDLADALELEYDGEQEALLAIAGALGGVANVTPVLAYHVTEDWRPSPSVLNAKKIKMLDGNYISGKSGALVANSSTSGFVATDIKTTDGGIHIIDTVLLP